MKNLLTLHEAIVIALINQPNRTAHFDTIAAFIEQRNLFPFRKGGISLAKQVMLRSTKSKGAYHNLFEEIGAGFIKLRNTIDGLYNLSLLEALLTYDKRFFNPPAKTLSVVDTNYGAKETKKLNLYPSEIICIVAVRGSRRKKIFVKKESPESEAIVTCYLFNNNSYNFEKLCHHLDPVNANLVVISKSAIVNVACYHLLAKNTTHIVPSLKNTVVPSTLKISAATKTANHLQAYTLVREAYIRRFLLQKTAIGYKMDRGL